MSWVRDLPEVTQQVEGRSSSVFPLGGGDGGKQRAEALRGRGKWLSEVAVTRCCPHAAYQVTI